MTVNRFNFRLWLKSNNRMYKVHSLHFGTKKAIISNKEEKYGNWSRKIDDNILMQSTGLVDRNGKEIFEGDILKTNLNDNIFIKYSNKLARFTIILIHPEYKDEDCCGDFVWDEFVRDAKFCEVIGNIYENKDILGE